MCRVTRRAARRVEHGKTTQGSVSLRPLQQHWLRGVAGLAPEGAAERTGVTEEEDRTLQCGIAAHVARVAPAPEFVAGALGQWQQRFSQHVTCGSAQANAALT
ncbi:MAG: hypothetical protein F4Y29_02880 [Chloroflexi bacterium]|nr:hypothetical protein [Chloroflexota bacterium]MDE2709041.1 hypothetical protein [Chloroflexota bacterium]MXY86560.1 hypothetical protein [Chloroflexota bacterium]MYB21461.1 hypothetical protein [Chloroflexota bacterium]